MMNKKYLMLGLPILAIGLVMAGVMAYYGMFSQEITIASAIETDCETTDIDSTFSGETVIGDTCTITNKANTKRIINITNDAPEGIEVSYRGNLFMTQKDLVSWTATGLNTTITYTVVGDTFKVSGVPSGYTAVYYPNKNTYSHYDGVIVLADEVIILPVSGDLNGGIESNYCTLMIEDIKANPEATQCVGAKLWLVPNNTVGVGDNIIDWSVASKFYFETELIQYNADGLITLSNGSSLTITPVYEIGMINGTYTINTTIA